MVRAIIVVEVVSDWSWTYFEGKGWDVGCEYQREDKSK
jgi:hypothetical protein